VWWRKKKLFCGAERDQLVPNNYHRFTTPTDSPLISILGWLLANSLNNQQTKQNTSCFQYLACKIGQQAPATLGLA